VRGQRIGLDVGTSLYLGGRWAPGSGETLEVVDPTTEDTLAAVPSATAAEVEEALSAARTARSAWAPLSPVTRSPYLRRLAALLLEESEPLAELLVREVGKPLAQARNELTIAAEYLRYTAEWDRRLEGDVVPSDSPNEVINLMRMPVGVVAAICAWNYPIALYVRKVAPALLTGNTVVLKPSEVTPLSSIALTRLIDEKLDLPPGVLNLVTGGAETGQALVRSRSTDLVTFTGHRDTGRQIMATAAENLTGVSLEHGGKAPAIVLAGADMQSAVRAVIVARHTNSGQVCTCAERVFVEEPVFDEFVEAYASQAAALRLGDPMTDVDLGPLVNAEQLRKGADAVATAQSEGASVVLGGARPEGEAFARGFWYPPTVLVDVTPDMQVMREETFAPITPIMKVGSLDEAIEYANDSRYGLSAYVFSNDYRRVMRAANDLDFGEIYVNRTLGEALQAHHIGYRESGLGGEDGKYGVLKYTQLRSVYHNFDGPDAAENPLLFRPATASQDA
jgi:lactaldehyde dehydrogenase / glycolaldehyde dehydrogenase